MKHHRFLLFVFFFTTIVVGVFALSRSFLIAQTTGVDSWVACQPILGSATGEFTGTLQASDSIPKNTDPLTDTRTFVLNCYNKQDPSNEALKADSNPITAQVIFVDLTAGTPSFAGAGTGVANQFYEGTLTISGKVTNIGNTAVQGGFTNLYQYRKTGNTAWNDLTIPLPLKSSPPPSLGVQGSGTNTADVKEHSWTGGAGDWEFQLCANRPYADLILVTPPPVTAPDANTVNDCSATPVKITVVPKLTAAVDLVVTDDTGVEKLQGAGGALASQKYAGAHILRWTSQNVAANSCTLRLENPAAVLLSSAPAQKSAPDGVPISSLVNTSYKYIITCTAAPNAFPSPVSDEVTIQIDNPKLTCAPFPTSAQMNETIDWTAFPLPDRYPDGTKIPYGFLWSNLTPTYQIQNGGTLASNPLSVKYSDAGDKGASVALLAPGGRSASATCQPKTAIIALPDLTANKPSLDGQKVPGATDQFYKGKVTLFGSLNNGGDADIPGIDTTFANRYEYRLKGNTTWNPLATVFLKDQSANFTRATPRDTQSFSWDAGVGIWEFRLVADIAGAIKEKNETEASNASAVLTVTIKEYDPALAGVSITCNGAGGTVAVENPGTCNLAWSAANASSCTATADPANANWNGGLSQTGGAWTGSTVSSPMTANTTFAIKCYPLAGALSQIPVSVSVTAAPFSAACSGSPNPQTLGNPVTWKADAAKLASGNSYTYSWSGSDGLTGTGASVQKTYDSVATPLKTANVSISTTVNGAAFGPKKSPDCSVTITAPDLTSDTPTMAGSPTGIENQFYKGSVTISGILQNGGTANIPALDTNFANQFRFRSKDAPPWTYLATTFLDNQSTDFSKGTSRAVKSPPSWEAGIGNWEFQLCADTSKNITEPPGKDYLDAVNIGNNCSVVPLSVSIIDRPPGPAASLFFNSQALAATVENGGGGYLTWKCADAAGAAASGAPAGSNFMENIPLENTGTGYFVPNLSQKATFTIECAPKQGSLFGPASASVVVLPFSPSCSVLPTNAILGQSVTWSGGANAINNPYSYEWKGDVTGLDPNIALARGYATVGTKSGTITVSSSVSSGGQLFTFPKSATCMLPVTGPDLTAALSISGFQTGNANEFYADATKLTGAVTNNGTASAPRDLPNLYLYSASGGTEGNWGDWLHAPLSDTSSALTPGPSRTVVENTWTPTPGGPWYFRLCADQKVSAGSPPKAGYDLADGVVTEIDENNNCAQIGPYSFVERPKVPVITEFSCNGASGVVGTENPGLCTLKWSAQNVSVCTASASSGGANWSGELSASGGLSSGTKTSSQFTQNTVFNLECEPLSGSLGSKQFRSITAVPFTPLCSASPAPARVNESVSWSASPSRLASGNPYTYSWFGAVTGLGSPLSQSYGAVEEKSSTVAVSTTVGGVALGPKLASCATTVIAPNLTANTPSITGNPAGTTNTFYAGDLVISGSLNNTTGSTDFISSSATGFTNRYEYRVKGQSGWTLLAPTYLAESVAFAKGDPLRAVKPFTWTGGAGDWEFQLVSDTKNDIAEANETDNESGVLSITVKSVPPVTAALYFNGKTGTSVLDYQGGGYMTWTSQNAASCSASSAPADSRWSGDVGLSKTDTSKYVSPITQKTVFTVTCKSLAGSIGGEAISSVTVIPFSLSCTGTDGTLATPVSWSAKPLPAPDANNAYTYLWSGSDSLSDTRVSFSKQYSSIGVKSASVTATRADGSGAAKTASCSATVAAPDLTASLLQLKDKNGAALPPGSYWGGEDYALVGTVINGGTVSVPGIFSSLYHYAQSYDVGYDFSKTWLNSSANLDAGQSRDANSYVWKPLSVSDYYFSFCADEDADNTVGYSSLSGSVKETNENNNCAIIGPYKFPPRPVISVDLLVDGKLAGAGGTIELPYGAKPMLSWTTTGSPDSCTASLDWSNAKTATGGSEPVGPLSAKSVYDFKLSCTKAGALAPVTDTARVNIAPTVSCAADKASAFVDELVSWKAVVQSPTQYTVLWSSSDSVVTGSANPNSVTYQSAGEKHATVTATANGVMSQPAVCTAPVVSGAPPPSTFITIKTRPAGPTADILFNGSQGPITIPYNGSGEIKWTSTNASSCAAASAPDDVSNWRGGLSGAFGNVGVSNLKTTHTFSLACQPLTGSLAGPAADSVKVIPLSVSCTGKPASVFVNDPVTWTATPSGGNGSYTYLWSGDDQLSATNGPKTGNDSVGKIYATAGNKTAKVFVRSDGGESAPATCTAETTGTPYVVVKPRPVISVDLLVDGKLSGAGGTIELPYGAKPMLSWTTTGSPDSCTASGDWNISPAPAGGSAQVGPLSSKSTYDFTISCAKTGALAPVTDTAKVRITPVVSCAADRNGALVGEPISWSATVQSATQYTLLWSGSENLSGTVSPIQKIYQTAGEKTAHVSVTADGLTATADCKAPDGSPGPDIQVFPDLTANAPAVSGPKIGNLYIAQQALTIDGSINNIGTGATSDGQFTNLYQASLLDPPRADSDWFDFAPTYLKDGTLVASGAAGANRPLKSYSWGQDGSIAPGVWHFRVCADQNVSSPPNPGYSSSDGTVTENNARGDAETAASNCSSGTRIEISNAPTVIVASTRDGAPSTGVSIVGFQEGTSGVTAGANGQYTIVKTTGAINTTLTAPAADGGGGAFTGWSGCDAMSSPAGDPPDIPARTCAVSANVGVSKTVTASYASTLGSTDLIFEGRTAGAASWSSSVTLPFNQNLELRYLSPTNKCTSGTATGDWSGSRAITATEKKETLNQPFAIRSYSFDLTCTNAASRSSLKKTVSVTVVAPDLTAGAPLVEGTKDAKGNFIAGTAMTISGKVNNPGNGATPNGSFVNLYQYSTNNLNWWDFRSESLVDTSTAVDIKETGREVTPYTWGEHGEIAAGAGWYFRLCADQQVDDVGGYSPTAGTVPEANVGGTAESEASNCSPVAGPFTVVAGSPPPQGPWSLQIQKDGTRASDGKVTSNPLGINCGGDCAETYVNDERVTLTATAPSSVVFAGWSGAPECTDGKSTCFFVIKGQRVVTATFNSASGGPLSVGSCYGSPANPGVGWTVTWKTNASGGKTPYSYNWSFPTKDKFTGADKNGKSTAAQPTGSYPANGTKNASITVTDAAGASVGPKSCTDLVVCDPDKEACWFEEGEFVPENQPGGTGGQTTPVPQFEEF